MLIRFLKWNIQLSEVVLICFLKERLSSKVTPRFFTNSEKVIIESPSLSEGAIDLHFVTEDLEPIRITCVLLWFNLRKTDDK